MRFGLLSCIGLGFDPELRIDTMDPPIGLEPDEAYSNIGIIGVSWTGDSRLWFAHSLDSGMTWGETAIVNSSEGAVAADAGMATDDAGRFFCVWEDNRGPESCASYFAMSPDGGGTWTDDMRISASGATSTDPDIAAAANGATLVSVFNHLSERRIYCAYSTDLGSTWVGDIAVGDGLTTGMAYGSTVCWVGGNSFVAVWNEYRAPSPTSLYCSISQDGGATWSTPNTPIPSGNHGILPGGAIKLCWDGSRLHLSWVEQYWTACRAEVNEVYYQHSDNGGTSWLPAASRVDQGGSDRIRRGGGVWARSPEEAYVCWMEYDAASDSSQALCSRSLDGGSVWEQPIIANPITNDAFRCDVSGNAQSGFIYMTWANFGDHQIWFARGHEMTGIEEEPVLPSPEILSANPNPCSSMVSISWSGETQEPIKVSDISGRTIAELDTSLGAESASWDASEALPGIYLIHFRNGSATTAARVVVIH